MVNLFEEILLFSPLIADYAFEILPSVTVVTSILIPRHFSSNEARNLRPPLPFETVILKFEVAMDSHMDMLSLRTTKKKDQEEAGKGENAKE